MAFCRRVKCAESGKQPGTANRRLLARRSAKWVNRTPISSEITITTISGALPEPRIQSTFTLFRLSTAKSVAMIASTTSTTVRARSRRRARPACG